MQPMVWLLLRVSQEGSSHPLTYAAAVVLIVLCVLRRLILGEGTPLPVVLSLLPIMAGVALASAGELSFNWTGFISAMLSNLTFGFRAVWGKR
jgi:NAD/NADP transhydrogenase beta subunit